MRRYAAHHCLDFHSAPVASIEPAAGGLGGYRVFRNQALFLDEVPPAETVAVLLQDSEREVHAELAVVAELLQDCPCRDHGGCAAFLVRGSPAPHQSVLDQTRERVSLPARRVPHLDGVHVRVDGQLPRPTAHTRNDASQAVEFHLVEPRLGAQRGDLPADRFFLSAEGGNPDDGGKDFRGMVAELTGGFEDLGAGVAHRVEYDFDSQIGQAPAGPPSGTYTRLTASSEN